MWPPADPFLVGLGIVSLLTAAAEHQPVVCILDVLSHEHDVRAALGDSSFRDHADVIFAANLLTSAVPPGLRFDLDGNIRGHAGADVVAELTASPFEVLRLRLGRRSRAQVLAMAWTGDPQPFLDELFIFGPAADDLTE